MSAFEDEEIDVFGLDAGNPTRNRQPYLSEEKDNEDEQDDSLNAPNLFGIFVEFSFNNVFKIYYT